MKLAPATVHSRSTQRHSDVRTSYLPGDRDDGTTVLEVRGRVKELGGETAWLCSSDQLGRSCGRSAAVQSSPIHQRWFS